VKNSVFGFASGLLATTVLVATSQLPAQAQANVAASGMDQVTSVSQLSDVKPTDWAFQALQSLVERYGCIVGYPDRTYRGNRALTRYEFAAGLNACMDRVNELIAAATNDLAKKEDLAALQKLQEEFAAELATLRGRVDALDAKVATLEKQQFSTTTKLTGEVVMALSDEFGTAVDNESVFQHRTRLVTATSFTGSDQLYIRMGAGNGNAFNLGPNGNFEGLQLQSLTATTNNSLYIDWVGYYGNINDKLRFYLTALGGGHYDFIPTANPVLDVADAGTTTLSFFGQRNPIYMIGAGSGAGVVFDPGPFAVSAGYFADNSGGSAAGFAPVGAANDPAIGLFDGSYSAMGQITLKPSDKLVVTLNYVNAYRQGGGIFDIGAGGTGFVGTTFANKAGDGITGPLNLSAKVNAFGAAAGFRMSKNLALNGFLTYGKVDFVGDGQGEKDLWSYGLGVALPDFGKPGNLLGFVIGAEPYRLTAAAGQIPLHVEGFYRYQLNDKISVTPGVIWIKNPGQNDSNADAVIGSLRTTFSF
jgi:hypothetical protein